VLFTKAISIALALFCVLVCVLSLVVLVKVASTSASDGLERHVYEMICVLMGTLSSLVITHFFADKLQSSNTGDQATVPIRRESCRGSSRASASGRPVIVFAQLARDARRPPHDSFSSCLGRQSSLKSAVVPRYTRHPRIPAITP